MLPFKNLESAVLSLLPILDDAMDEIVHDNDYDQVIDLYKNGLIRICGSSIKYNDSAVLICSDEEESYGIRDRFLKDGAKKLSSNHSWIYLNDGSPFILNTSGNHENDGIASAPLDFLFYLSDRGKEKEFRALNRIDKKHILDLVIQKKVPRGLRTGLYKMLDTSNSFTYGFGEEYPEQTYKNISGFVDKSI